MASQERPLRILSLDGGGVRGLSSIMILKHIMEGVNEQRALDDQLEPCQIFDMIGGTSTGGIIALMLGRLRMRLSDCEDAYLQLSEKIFTPRRQKINLFGHAKDFLQADGRFDANVLESAIKDCISTVADGDGTATDADVLLKDPESPCKVFVVTARENNCEPAVLRSYKNSRMTELLYDECRVWEACRATSAATTFFDPIQIGKYKQRFIDGAALYNNPIQIAYREAENIWPGRETLILSIGTGSAPGKPFKGNLKAIVESMKRIVTETERTANDFYLSHSRLVTNDLLFRFNATHGVSDIGLQEYKEISTMADATQTYLDQGKTGKDLSVCIHKLSANISEDSVGIRPAEVSSSKMKRTRTAAQRTNNHFVEAAKKADTALLLAWIKNDAIRPQLNQESVNIALIELTKNVKYKESRRIKAVDVLLDKCAPDLECKDTKYGRTPLIWAVCYGREAIIKLLIGKGARLEALDEYYGRTPLLWAARSGTWKAAELLLEKIQDEQLIHAKDRDGNTALALAYAEKHFQTAKALLHYGANPNFNIESGLPLLVSAVEEGDEDFVRLLVDNGADVQCLSLKNIPVLSVAVFDKSLAMVKMLIDNGADVQTSDSQGRTPLIWAIKRLRVDIVELLINEGANRNVADRDWRMAQYWAQRTRRQKIIDLVRREG